MKAPERRRTNKTIFSRILPPGPVLICICVLKLIPFNLFLICGDARSCLVKKYETIIKCTDNSSSEDNYRVMITRVESVWFTDEYTSYMKKIAVKPGSSVLFLQSVFTWRYGGHIGVPKQWNGGHVGVTNQSCGSWTPFLWNRFLLFQ